MLIFYIMAAWLIMTHFLISQACLSSTYILSEQLDCNAKISTAQNLVDVKLSGPSEASKKDLAPTTLPILYLSTQDSIRHYTELDSDTETLSDYLIKSSTTTTEATDMDQAIFVQTRADTFSTTQIKRVQVSKALLNAQNTAKSLNSYTKVNESMTNMTKSKLNLFKRLNFASSEFFLYNNFIASYLRNRKNAQKFKSLSNDSSSAATAAPPTHPTVIRYA